MNYMDMLLMVHTGLPREGPGNAASTRRAFSLLKNLPPEPEILDIGCGPGMQTMELAAVSGARITAMDYFQKYLDVLREKTHESGAAGSIIPVRGDMNRPPFADSSFDLIWSEGAVYIMGLEKGLRSWKRLLRDRGCLAVSELTWLKPNPPAELRNFWGNEYPEMQNIQANLEAVKKCGYTSAGHFILPEAAWWDDYYLPLQERLKELRTAYKNDPGVLAYLNTEKKEIDLYRRYSQFYGYVFYVMQKAQVNG